MRSCPASRPGRAPGTGWSMRLMTASRRNGIIDWARITFPPPRSRGSLLNKTRNPDMSAPSYDTAIIGAGIHGAAFAQVAAERGYSCLVLEQYSAPAQGTSSRSSKLIHGGPRYLETAHFNLVRECLRERARLLAEFPDLVREVAFYIPIYNESKRRPWQIASGLLLYQVLGGKGFHRVPKDRWRELDGIRMDGLQAV